MRVRAVVLALVCAFLVPAASASAQEVVLHATDVTSIKGNWQRIDTTSGAGGKLMSSTDHGWSSPNSPQASPNDYFEASFTAQAWVPYRIWVRVRAAGNSKWNESVWVQFNDSLDASGNAIARIGTASAVLVNLEACSGCGVSSWGWTGGSYWQGMNQQVQFPSSGTKTIRIQTREDGGQIDQIVLSPLKYLTTAPGSAKNDTTILPRSGGSTSGSSSTGAKAIPGSIEAQDFDGGGNGSAYYDTSSGNYGGQYRSTDVDIERTSDSSGTYNVGWIAAGEWLNYTVNVASAGSYTLEMRVASPSGTSTNVRVGGTDVTGTLSIPATGGWQNWTTVRKTVTLAAGTQGMRVSFPSGGANFNWIRFTQTSTGGGESGSGPFGGTAWAVPGTVQSEDFDLGGQNVGYYDNSNGNNGGKYRSTDVDIESGGSGYNVGWNGAGEWLNYTVNVASAGTYTLTARVASNGNGGTFYVEFGGSNKTGTMTVPNTGGWQSYRDVSATVSLSAGVQVMRVRMAGNGATGAVGNFDYIKLASGGTTTTTTTTTSNKIRIMTWNIHFGKNTSNVLNLETQAKIMADSGADVILLQEASTWDGDQPNRFPQLLQQYTGKTWYKVWSAHIGTSGEGTLILTKLPITSSSIANFHSRGFSRVAVTINGVVVDIFNGHLEYYDTSKRTSQLLSWMNWMRNYSGPEIAGGDFNSWWGEYWIKEMEKEYSDTWKDVTGSAEGGYTKGNVRFDYLFRAYDGNSRIKPTNIWVISTSASDHRPVVADYTVH